jgi:UDP-glucuronate decarboxylase
LRAQPITIYGDGSQTRSFCYVDDLVNGFLRFMDTSAEVTGPINLGNPNEFTIKDLAELVVELTGSRSTIEYKSLPQDDPLQRRPDIAMAKSILDWEPTVQLREGLLQVIDYFRRTECS